MVPIISGRLVTLVIGGLRNKGEIPEEVQRQREVQAVSLRSQETNLQMCLSPTSSLSGMRTNDSMWILVFTDGK